MISNVLVCIFRNGDGIHASSSIRLVQTLLRFCIVEICRLILECILKCGYVIHHFNVHFSLCFFANDLLLDVYPVFILNYGSDARQKANSSNFLEFKMGSKAVETTQNINSALAQLLPTNIECSGGSRCFAKEMRALKMRSTMPGHQKWTTTNGEQLLKLILLQLQEKFPKNPASTILQFFGI